MACPPSLKESVPVADRFSNTLERESVTEEKTIETPSTPETPDDGWMKDGWIDLLGSKQLQIKILDKGIPKTRPDDGSMVRVKYKMWLTESGKFVHDVEETIFMGENDVIVAFELAMSMMNDQGKIRMKTVSRFAYGSQGSKPEREILYSKTHEELVLRGMPDIPPDADLTIDLDILEVKEKPDWTQVNPEELIKHAERKRLRGNVAFAHEEYSAAINYYSRAARMFDAENVHRQLDKSYDKEIADKRCKTYNNMAAAQLKVGAHSAAIRSSRIALEHEPCNVKAMYRMGKGFCGRGELWKAIETLEKALELEPDSKILQRELKLWRERQKRNKQYDVNMYKRMLGNIANVPYTVKKKSSGVSMFWTLVGGGVVAAMFSVGFAYYRSLH